MPLLLPPWREEKRKPSQNATVKSPQAMQIYGHLRKTVCKFIINDNILKQLLHFIILAVISPILLILLEFTDYI
jgi:hypothetical protein